MYQKKMYPLPFSVSHVYIILKKLVSLYSRINLHGENLVL